MSAIEDRENAVLIDLTRAVSSADAVRLLEENLEQSNILLSPGSLIDLNTGDLLLTSGILTKLKSVMKRFGVSINTLYSDVPQTQQYALDEGLLVRRSPPKREKFSSSSLFNPGTFMTKAYRDLDLPFENSSDTASSPVEAPGESSAPLSRLSMTREDGTREEIKSLQNVSKETLYYKQTLRSGQVLEAGGNVVVIGDVHSGSEILADGDILIWGFLGGIAHAGRRGYNQAEIRAIRIEAVQLRIGDCIARRPDRLFQQGLGKRRSLEVAKVKDGEIQIFEDIVER